VNFTQQQIADICRIYGPQLTNLPSGIDGAQLLWAIAGNESSFGENCAPRHEPAFDVGGVYGNGAVMKSLLAQYGSAAASSYGPWQILFCNCPAGYQPLDMGDLDKAAHATVRYLNQLIARWTCTGLSDVGECWNAGHPMLNPSAGVARYVSDLAGNYKVPMAT
jgi:hypothetical protein